MRNSIWTAARRIFALVGGTARESRRVARNDLLSGRRGHMRVLGVEIGSQQAGRHALLKRIGVLFQQAASSALNGARMRAA